MPDREPEVNFDEFLENLSTLKYSQCSSIEKAWRRSVAFAMRRLYLDTSDGGKKKIEDSFIMETLQVSRSVFYYWVAREEKNPGVGASGFKRGRAPQEWLNEEEQKAICTLVENKAPVECGIDCSGWSREAIATLIFTKFGKKVPLRWASRMAKRHGLVWKRSAKFALARNLEE